MFFHGLKKYSTGKAYHRDTTLVAQREYTYDVLRRPTARTTSRQGNVVNDTFVHNSRSELASAQVNGETYGYDYDNGASAPPHSKRAPAWQGAQSQISPRKCGHKRDFPTGYAGGDNTCWGEDRATGELYSSGLLRCLRGL